MFVTRSVFLAFLFGAGGVFSVNAANQAAATATERLNAAPSSAVWREKPDELAGTKLKVVDRLVRLYEILKSKEDVTLPDFSPDRVLRPSDKHESIPALREILRELGYLDKATDSPFYDMALEEAVRKFQAAHCVKPNGVIDEATTAKLNWPFAKRLKSLRESAEALKKIELAPKTAIVNIPTYRLYCFQDENQALEMKVIVGRPSRPTPLMTVRVNAITYFPWRILSKRRFFEDDLPKIQGNPAYFKENDLEVFEDNGYVEKEKDPDKIDWADVREYDFAYCVKQKPGAKNAFGILRFSFLENDRISMHDTPRKKLFKKNARAFSSGDIRVEKPVDLASWMLDKDKETIVDELKKIETVINHLRDNVLTIIAYLPVWIEENGRVLWGDDPYELQPKPDAQT